LRREADEVHCLHTPEEFLGIGQFYLNFHQLSDREVIALLDEAKRFSGDQVATLREG
jgi:predicted phosphoribosyltransferase